MAEGSGEGVCGAAEMGVGQTVRWVVGEGEWGGVFFSAAVEEGEEEEEGEEDGGCGEERD